MSLVELLIVVTIILVLMVVSIPALRPGIQENKLREASRQLNVLVLRAKARAAELQRRVAIWMERSAPGSNAAIDIYLAEAPAEYSGDLQDAKAFLYYDPTIRKWRLGFDANCPCLLGTDGTALILPGETFKIRFGNKGVWYDALRETSSGDYFLRPPYALITGASAPAPPDTFVPPPGFFRPGPDGSWGKAPNAATNFNGDDDGNGLVDEIREAGTRGSDENLTPTTPFTVSANAPGLPFQIQLAPRKVASSLVQLPDGTAVDLGFSGLGISLPTNRTAATTAQQRFSGLEFQAANVSSPLTPATNNSPVLIIFDAIGEVEAINYDNTVYEPTAPIHLLVGFFDQVINEDGSSATASPMDWSSVDSAKNYYSKSISDRNIVDLRCIWVSIGDRTGTVTSSENVWDTTTTTPPYFYNSLRAAREFAQKAQTMGGR